VGGLSQAKLITIGATRDKSHCGAVGEPVRGSSMASELAFATLPGFAYPTDHGIELVQETLDHFVDIDQFDRSGAFVRIPCGPGIGVEVDNTMLDNLAIRRLTKLDRASQSA